MSVNYVRVYYGPNESFYTVCHRPQKLRGLKEFFQIDYKKSPLAPFYKTCLVPSKVFRCNIKNLSFNCPCDRDPVCLRAVAAVVNSSVKFLRARSYLWSWALVEEQIFRRSEYSPKDYWPFGFECSNACYDCVACCVNK